MGAWGAIIMGFFGAVFAAMTLAIGFRAPGPVLATPFLVFAAIALAARAVIRLPGAGISPSRQASNAIMWSSIAEGVGLFVAANVVNWIGHPEWLLPAFALVVGLHFVPIGWVARFPPYLVLAGALMSAALIGVLLPQPAGARVAGFAAAIALWFASVAAIVRDRRAKRG